MTVPKATIEFVETTTPVFDPVTKFGGQPVWVDHPMWPKSAETGNPMRFICQIHLPAEIFGVPDAMAYLFMTDEEDNVGETWEPFGGENALIVQRGDGRTPAAGPTLYKMVEKPGATHLVEEACEYVARLTAGTDPEFIPEVEVFKLPESEQASYMEALSGNKIGGTPGFMQGDEYPSEDVWRLLLQLDSTLVPFSVNFGDCGIGYAFVRPDLSEGQFLWQCA